MVEKYGKPIKMKKIKRDLQSIYKKLDDNKTRCEKYYKGSESSNDGKCRICCSKDNVLFASMNRTYNYYQCNECGALFLDNLPDVKKMYTEDNSSGNTKEYIDEDIYNNRVEMISAPKVEFVLDICNNSSIETKSWFDIGCGGGEILYYLLHNTNIKGTGLESDPSECAFLKSHGINFYESYIDLEHEDTKVSELINNSDVVSFINVLEHVENPKGFINYIHESMKKNAVMVFEVPRHPSLASFANMTCENNVYRHIDPPVHLQIFSDKSIDMLIDKKFNIIAKWEYGQGYTDLLTNSMIHANMKSSDLYDALMETSNKVQEVIDKCGFADQMLVVAQKI